MRSTPNIFPPDAFISIVVTSYHRPFYLKRCLESLQKFADMPFEVIVHDDGSAPNLRDQVYKELNSLISTLILNLGTNMGLNVSSNRAIYTAQSSYVLFMNDDCFLTKPCFQKIVKALQKPYIGYVCPSNDFGDLNSSSKDVVVVNSFGGGHTQAFRREVWEQVGGWCEHNTTGQSDNVFLLKILKSGYFKGYIPGGPFVDVTHPNAAGYVDSFSFANGNDCSLPKLFNFDKSTQVALGHKRREFCQYWVDGERTIPGRTDGRIDPIAGLNDFGYWDIYLKSIVNNDGTINWENTIKHGQDKWRNWNV